MSTKCRLIQLLVHKSLHWKWFLGSLSVYCFVTVLSIMLLTSLWHTRPYSTPTTRKRMIILILLDRSMKAKPLNSCIELNSLKEKEERVEKYVDENSKSSNLLNSRVATFSLPSSVASESCIQDKLRILLTIIQLIGSKA